MIAKSDLKGLRHVMFAGLFSRNEKGISDLNPVEKNLRTVGTLGEEAALGAYCEMGFCAAARNWHFHRLGEIDLVLENREKELLVICEVKLRSDASFSAPSSAVNTQKQRRIRKLAACFIAEYPIYGNYYVRFDVCEVVPSEKDGFSVNIIENAF